MVAKQVDKVVRAAKVLCSVRKYKGMYDAVRVSDSFSVV